MRDNNITLDEWLHHIYTAPDLLPFAPVTFLTEEHYEEYLATVHTRTDDEVRQLLMHFLVQADTTGMDEGNMLGLAYMAKHDPERFRQAMKRPYNQRLAAIMRGEPHITALEGNTWILELLPESPHQALIALQGYIDAHLRYLSDGRGAGLHEAIDIIRAKYIANPSTFEARVRLLTRDLSPRQFELLVERLYFSMGYRTILTPVVKDGGYDVLAEKSEIGSKERILVECKLYTHRVGLRYISALQGRVARLNCNKGVIVTTDAFTAPARTEGSADHRMELIEGSKLIELLNAFLGSDWPQRLDSILTWAEREAILTKG